MPSMRKRKLIFFVVISYSMLMVANTTDPSASTSETKDKIERDFTVETVKHFREKIRGNEEKLEAHYFSKLSEKKRKKLCMEAKNSASFDGMGKHPEAVCKLTECSITYNDGSEDSSAIVLKCETIPVSYLWVPDTFNEDTQKMVLVFIRNNEYEKNMFSFNVRMLESKAKVKENSEGNSEEVAEDDMLMGLLQETRLQLCIAAKKHIKEVPRPVLETSKINTPQVFLMKFEKAEEYSETHAAIDCLSKPPMYVYFGEKEDEIAVALVKVATEVAT